MKPWSWVPAKLAHDLAPWALRGLSPFLPANPPQWRPYQWRHLIFPNPVGVAGGVDKDAVTLPVWPKLGAGFVEIGTVTPRAQGPNPGSILMRDMQHQALWNKMGFPSQGVQSVRSRLEHRRDRVPVPVFANVGKNRTTPNERAHEDYLEVMNQLSSFVDGFVINISSPNTKDLRDLQGEKSLREFLNPLVEWREAQPHSRPLLLKLSPDLDDTSLASALHVSVELNLDGWVLTNTTRERTDARFPTDGGVSGAPLTELSRNRLEYTVSTLGPEGKKNRLLISVGGILSAEEIQLRLSLGADLVEVYSALIFHGPLFFRNAIRQLQGSTNSR